MVAALKGIIQRFEEGILKITECDCWEVAPTSKGYGKFNMLGETWRYHRASFELYVGRIPKGKMVCHKCDNPKCVNPKHLFLGTAQDNMDDKMLKGRHVAHKGQNHHSAKLVDWQVIEIKKHISEGKLTLTKLAEMYGVSQTLISNIKSKKRWSHVK